MYVCCVLRVFRINTDVGLERFEGLEGFFPRNGTNTDVGLERLEWVFPKQGTMGWKGSMG